MPKLGPIKRKELIHFMRQLGFDGPYGAAKHSFVKRGALKIRIPNTDIDRQLLRRILRQAGISEEEWEKL
jgi:predicted RNA binding protein YcfA (HicA-like mRNA interferase family)